MVGRLTINNIYKHIRQTSSNDAAIRECGNLGRLNVAVRDGSIWRANSPQINLTATLSGCVRESRRIENASL